MSRKNHIIRTYPCFIPGCENIVHSTKENLCLKHYGQKRHQNAVIASREEIEKRFWKFAPKGLSFFECWNWKGSTEYYGHGHFKLKYKVYKAHQVSYYLHTGDWAKNCVLHSCDNPPCVNPFHLRDGTQQENMQDARDRNRFALGSKSSNAKLNEEQVKEIKLELQHSNRIRAIATKYQVCRSAIRDIKVGRTWRHIIL